ncbi:hypothetical protein GCM10020331_000530 [Ectobacillus funiculus]
MTNQEKEVLVIGGGIGGVAAALASAEAGHKTKKFLEQAPQFGEIGAGIQMGPNAMAVLERFGVAGEIAKVAVFPKKDSF